MNVPGITDVGAGIPQTEATSSRDALGSDAFLKLLVTQLENQDPTSPQEQGDFIAQLAQFSSLEKLTVIASGIEELLALMAEQTRPLDVGSEAPPQGGDA